MSTVHAGYTVIAPLKADGEEPARALLRAYHAEPARLPFARSATTHFASGVVIPEQTWGGERLPATLMLATSFCGPTDEHVAELVRFLGPGLRALFRCCEDAPDDDSDQALAGFLQQHRRADTFYSGMQHVTPEDARREHELRTAIEDFVDLRQRDGGFTGAEGAIRAAIQDHVAAQGFGWALRPLEIPVAPDRGKLVMPALKLLGLVWLALTLVVALVRCPTLGVVVAAGWLVVIAPILFLVALMFGVRDAEEQQREVAGRPPDDFARSIAATQNQPVINEMTVVGPIKEGVCRPLFLRIALWAIARAQIGNIRTVATARWVTIDRGRRLIFISNFTNAAEPYVRDFIDTRDGAMRINLAFGFGGGYPRTRWILLDGAIADSNAFIYVVTSSQRQTEFWYCPYRNLSIDNINVNRQIRAGLAGPMSDAEAGAWLQLL